MLEAGKAPDVDKVKLTFEVKDLLGDLLHSILFQKHSLLVAKYKLRCRKNHDARVSFDVALPPPLDVFINHCGVHNGVKIVFLDVP